MERTPVRSSTVASVGYDADSATLEVEFIGGSVYHYFNVPQDVFEAFINAESVGGYLSSEIKGVYGYAKV